MLGIKVTMTKEIIHQGFMVILNLYAFENIPPKYIEQNLIRSPWEMDKFIVIVGGFRIALSEMYRSSEEKKVRSIKMVLVSLGHILLNLPLFLAQRWW